MKTYSPSEEPGTITMTKPPKIKKKAIVKKIANGNTVRRMMITISRSNLTWSQNGQ